MSLAGENLARTQHGEQYNKLKRPDDFIAALAAPAPKRTQDQAEINDDIGEHAPPTKRTRDGTTRHEPSRHYARARTRAPPEDCGMRSMFPGMIDNGDASDDSTNEALAYLRSVRSEAQSIPSLLVAEPQPTQAVEADRSTYRTKRGEPVAVFEDGAWVARDPTHLSQPPTPLDGTPELDPQEQYYKNLLRRYSILRKTLVHGSLADLNERLAKTPDRCTSTAPPRTRKDWLYVLDREYPTPAQIFQMDERDIFQGLRYCAYSLDRFGAISKQKSCWVWALLAKTPESGDLDYTRVGMIRDLGHKAGQYCLSLRNGAARDRKHNHSEDEDVEDEDWYADSDGTPEEINASESDIQSPQPRTEKSLDSDADSSADMSMSEDGEVEEPDEPTTLEEARARLLAQLGDRLVQAPSGSKPSQTKSASQPPHKANDQPASSSSEPPRGKRHRHNGKLCFQSACAPGAPKKSLQKQTQRVKREHSQSSPLPQPSDPSHTKKEADASNDTTTNETPTDTSNLTPKKVFASRAEAELHRQLNHTKEEEQEQEQDRPMDIASDGDDHPSQTTTPTTATTRTGPRFKEIQASDANSKATIDMILTVVAERYGQRDLLRFRDVWA